MAREKNRKAYFHCSLIYLDPNNTSNPVLIETQWHGIICSEKSGHKDLLRSNFYSRTR